MNPTRTTSLLVMLCLLAAPAAIAQPARVASDFELAQMQRQLESSRGFLAQLSARLNLGDIRATRNERSLARAEYSKALELANQERIASRQVSDVARYSTATSYAALAEARLGRGSAAFQLAEEALRFSSGNAPTWNLYASTMMALGKPRKAVSAARNAVAIASLDDDALDVEVYRYALASALLESRESDEAERVLSSVVASLRSPRFDEVRAEAARQEAFEIQSTARGDVAAFVSLLNRSQLRLAATYEKRGDTGRARLQYQQVLEGRSDDVTALAAIARLASSGVEREEQYALAFDANPLSTSLIDEYRRYLRGRSGATIDGASPGAQMRRVLTHLEAGDRRAARVALGPLLERFPASETLLSLRREASRQAAALIPPSSPTGVELRALLEVVSDDRLTPEHRATLDQTVFSSVARFDAGPAASPGQTIFETGTIDGVRFRFSEPIVFTGSFDPSQRLTLTYRILGATRFEERDVLLLEPKGLAVTP